MRESPELEGVDKLTEPRLRAYLAQRLIHLDGSPFSLDDYPFYVPIYNGQYQNLHQNIKLL